VLQDANGWAPLHYAVQDERLAVAASLLQSGGTVDVQTADGLTPLLLAAQRSSLDAVRLLLRHGANADAREVRSRMLPDQCRFYVVSTPPASSSGARFTKYLTIYRKIIVSLY